MKVLLISGNTEWFFFFSFFNKLLFRLLLFWQMNLIIFISENFADVWFWLILPNIYPDCFIKCLILVKSLPNIFVGLLQVFFPFPLILFLIFYIYFLLEYNCFTLMLCRFLFVQHRGCLYKCIFLHTLWRHSLRSILVRKIPWIERLADYPRDHKELDAMKRVTCHYT